MVLEETTELWRERPETAGKEVPVPVRNWCPTPDTDLIIIAVYVEATKWILP